MVMVWVYTLFQIFVVGSESFMYFKTECIASFNRQHWFYLSPLQRYCTFTTENTASHVHEYNYLSRNFLCLIVLDDIQGGPN